jgi:hypothetical protein
MPDENLSLISAPTPKDIHRISTLDNPVIRNLQITQCYHELSSAFTSRTGKVANWCTFAAWASKQAGQTIRKEDFKRLLESRLHRDARAIEAAENLAASARPSDGQRALEMRSLALDIRNYKTATQRASDAVGRGNKKVFEEIGYEFARFFETCLADETPDQETISRFCEELRPGDPPEGQRYLRQAFSHYYQSMFETDKKAKAELVFLANIEIGFHEQTRLQPEIAESLDAGLNSALSIYRLLAGFFPVKGVLAFVHLLVMRILGRPTEVDIALERLLKAVQSLLRQTITELMMAIALPSGAQLRLGKDLNAGFPPSLQTISHPELKDLLEKLDPTPDSPVESGALDWADLPDRLHFILDLFRCYQENQDLLQSPFATEQVSAFKAGKLPAGRL